HQSIATVRPFQVPPSQIGMIPASGHRHILFQTMPVSIPVEWQHVIHCTFGSLCRDRRRKRPRNLADGGNGFVTDEQFAQAFMTLGWKAVEKKPLPFARLS